MQKRVVKGEGNRKQESLRWGKEWPGGKEMAVAGNKNVNLTLLAFLTQMINPVPCHPPALSPVFLLV